MANSNDIPEGYKATELGVLPLDWQIKKIGELFNVQQGISMSKARRDGPNKYPFLRTLNVFWRGIDLTTLDYMDFSEKEIEKLNLLPGDLLVCEGGDIGRTAMWRGELESCGYQNHLHRLRVKNDDVDPEFVAFWMQAAMEILGFYQDEGNKTTIPNLSQSRLKNFDIPLPPLPEQRAIAATLRTVQEAKERTDAVIAAIKALKAAMMKHLFTYGPVPPEEAERVALKETEIGSVPEVWDVENLGKELIEKTINGAFIRRDDFGRGFPFLNVADVYPNIHPDFDKVERVEISEKELKRFSLYNDDLIYVRSSLKREGIAQCCIIKNPPKDAIFDCHLMRVRVNKQHIFPEYLTYYSVSSQARTQLISLSKTTTMTTINQQNLSKFKILIPPLKIQQKITSILSSIDQKLAAEQSRKEALDTLFTSLLHDLMTAKIRVKPAEA